MSFIACRSEIDDFNDWTFQILEQNVLRFQVAMYQPSLVEESKAIQELLSKHPYQCGTKAPELVLFDELVEIDAEQFKD